jgi:hypothetical protein
VLVDGTSGPRETEFSRGENDPNPQRIPFQFAVRGQSGGYARPLPRVPDDPD